MNPVKKKGKGIFSIFGKKTSTSSTKGGKGKNGKKTISAPLPPVMPPAGKSPEIDIDDTLYASDFQKYINNNECSDVTLNVKGKTYDAHKIILSSSSEIFESLFIDNKIPKSGIIKEYKDDIIIFDEDIVDDENVFKYILEFFYVGYIKEIANAKLIDKVLELGKLFKVTRIEEFCGNMKQILTGQDNEFFKVLNLSLQSYILDERGKAMKNKYFNQNQFSDISFLIPNDNQIEDDDDDNEIDNDKKEEEEITIEANENKEILLHKSILCLRSDYFKTMLFSNFMEGKTSKVPIELDEGYSNEFEIYLKFLYTDHTYNHFTNENVLKILQLSNKFMNNRLKTFSEVFVSKLVEKECSDKIERAEIDVIPILIFADINSAKQLKKFCLHFIASNYQCFKRKETWKDLKEHKELFKYVEENQWPPKSYMKDVAKYEKKLAAYYKKIGKKKKVAKFTYIGRKDRNPLDDGKKIELTVKNKSKKKKLFIPFNSFSQKTDVDDDISLFLKT